MLFPWSRRKVSSRASRRARSSKQRFWKCHLEVLEDRTLPSHAYLVNLAGDATAVTGTMSAAFSGDLRYCIVQADGDAGSTITFNTAATGPTIALAQGELAISANMTITGPGPGSLTVTGNSGTAAGSSRVFDVTASAAVVTISGLTITGGNASTTISTTPGRFGGDIFNNGTLTLTNDVVSGGTAKGGTGTPGGSGQSAAGGGIDNGSSARLTVSGTVVTGNTATAGAGGAETTAGGAGGSGGAARGGGIYNGWGASLTLVDGSQVMGNMAVGGAGGTGAAATTAGTTGGAGGIGGSAQGGGVYSSGTLFIGSTTFSGNTAQGGLGGAGAAGATGTDAGVGTGTGGTGGTGGAGGRGGAAFGGGVDNGSNALGIDQSPFSNNQALSGGGGAGATGGAGGTGGTLGGNGGDGGTGGRGGDQGVAKGGGVFASGGDLSIFNSPFTSNTAQTAGAGAGGPGGAGGAGLFAGTNQGNGGGGGRGGGTRDDSHNTNGSSAFGGGVAVTTGNLNITGSAFSQNHVVGGPAGQGGAGASGFTGGTGGAGGDGGSSWGGGVSASGTVGNVTISGSLFTDNTNTSTPGGAGGVGGLGDATTGAGGQGGAGGKGGSSWGGGFSYHIQNGNSHTTANSLSVTSSPFSSNVLTSSAGGRGGDGGAGHNGGQGGQGGQSRDSWGGGLSSFDEGGPTNLTVNSSQFLSNTATVLAGGAGGTGGTAGAGGTGGRGGDGGECSSPWGGGISISKGASFSLTNSPLTNNIITATAGGAGGAGGAAGAGGTGGQGGDGGRGFSAWGGGIVFEPNVFNSTAGASSINFSPISGNQAIAAAGGVGGAGGSTSAGGVGGQGGQGRHGGSSWGGGVDISASSSNTPFGSVTLNSSPVTNNVATAGNGGVGGAGGSGGTGGAGGNGGSSWGGGAHVWGGGIASDNYNLILNFSPVGGNQAASGTGAAGGAGGTGTAGAGGKGGDGDHGGSARGGGVAFTGSSSSTGLSITINASDVTNNILTQGAAGAGGMGGAGTTTGGAGGTGSSELNMGSGRTVPLAGAGVSIGVGSAQITNSKIDGNIGTAGAGGAGGQGGAGGTGAAGVGGAGGTGGQALGGGVYFNNEGSNAETFSFSDGSASNNTLTSGAGGAGGAVGTGGTVTGVLGGAGGAGGSALGGGVYLNASGSGAITSTIDRAILDDNTLTSGHGGRGGDGGAGGAGAKGGSAQGGGIFDGNGSLTLSNSTLAGDRVSSGVGGGGGNGSSGDGGAGARGGSAQGGGLFFNASNLTVTNSTFGGTSADPTRPDQNRDVVSAGAGGDGGSGGLSGAVTAANGGAAGDGGTAQGGGAWVGSGTTATFRDDTITANQALAFGAPGARGLHAGTGTDGAPGTPGFGQAGGYFAQGGSTDNLGNTIIALNAAATDPDVFGTFASQGHNIIGDGTGGSGFVASDQVGVTAAMLKLGPLQNNGGPTPTDQLLPGSIAIDAGDNFLVPPGVLFDQRGPGFTRIFNGVVDVGAFEFGPSGVIVVPGTSGSDTLEVFQTPGHGAGDITYILNGGPPVELFNVTSFTFNGLGNDDTMIVDIPSGGVLVVGQVFFDGGPGVNTLVVNANGKTVKLEQQAQVITAADPQTIGYANVQAINLNDAAAVTAIAGPDTTDRATAFAGLTADERFVQALYLAELGRPGARSELDGWAALFASGMPNAQAVIATRIQHSQEAQDHLVKAWYLTFLGRTAQSGEELGWVALLQQGQTEEQVLSGILGSPEFYARAQTLIGAGSADERYVQALYLLLLDRTGEASAVAGWVAALPGVGQPGVALAFLQSQEFRADQFEGYYNALLRRPDDASGLNGWVLSAFDLASVRIAFEASPEFFTDG